MLRSITFWLFICLVINIVPGICANGTDIVEYEGINPLSQPVLSDYNGSDAITFTSEPDGTSPRLITIEEIQGEITRIIEADVDNTIVISKAHEIIRDAGCPGPYHPNQFLAIFDYLMSSWNYVSDPLGPDHFRPPSQTITVGDNIGCSGSGDCDDFAILMSALIEEIGGTTRIILAYGPTSGHAYTEVYLGKADDPKIDEIVQWLKKVYNNDDIVIDMRPIDEEVWLNLDWFAGYPGGSLYSAETHVTIFPIRSIGEGVSPGSINETEPALFQGPTLKIENLSEEFGIESEVNGTISGNLPDDQYVWLLINPHSAPSQWWPQGRRIEPDLQSGTWHGVARIGGGLGDIGKKFDVAVVRVSKEDDQELENWTKTGAVHNWSSISLPDSAILMDKKTVTARGPEIAIVDPEDESEVNITEEVNGTISTISGKLPDDYYLWLLVNPHSCSRQWWPQGCSEPNFLKGTWYVQAGFGGVNDTGTKFDIAAILVDKDDHKELEEVMKTGQSMPMPGDAKIMDRITVTRK